MTDLQAQNDSSIDTGGEVQDRHKFDENKLTEYLTDKVEGFKGPISVRQFRGGQSNPTYVISTPNKDYVLRRKPEGVLLPSAHAVDREYRVISAVHKVGFPVAKPYIFCEDTSIVGSQFYLSDYLYGRVFFDRSIPNVTASDRQQMLHSYIKTMSQLHEIDHIKIGLEDFGRPGNYFARQINRWSKQYKMSETRDIASMNYLLEWLPDNIPPSDTNVLIHGDYSLHNVMMHPEEPRLIAVLDWELSTTGHPLGDLFYALQPWYSPLEAVAQKSPSELKEMGIPAFEEMLEIYCQVSGADKVENISFYKGYNLFRTAAILQGIIGRVRDGTAARSDADQLAESVGPLADRALEIIQAS